ncbi:MAG: cystathionine gamma-lyase, partial [Solirubrobacteraceae bacterium]|nr:cystathionine gamma-lyase [Solirubrobacteraceae bacterium]
RGVEVRLVPTDHDAVLGAIPGATVIWIETPSNPGLDVLGVAALAGAAHDAGAELVVDNTLAGPLRQRALELGADVSVTSASKHLTGHSDLVLGYVAAREPERAAALRAWRGTTGAIPGPFEAWLAHRSLATLAVRLERQEASAAAIVEMLRARDDVAGGRWPGVGSVVCFTLESAERAQAFLAALTIVAEATSFGGLHSSAERRGRWGTDDVPEGFIRLSAGIEDTVDLVADIARALDATR